MTWTHMLRDTKTGATHYTTFRGDAQAPQGMTVHTREECRTPTRRPHTHRVTVWRRDEVDGVAICLPYLLEVREGGAWRETPLDFSTWEGDPCQK